MSIAVDPREVLQYLNELGFTNITAQQLKSFIKDLKKLIKYEQRIQSTGPKADDRNQIFSTLHNLDTIASKSKKVPKKANVISVEVKKYKENKPTSKTELEVEPLPVSECDCCQRCTCNTDEAKSDIKTGNVSTARSPKSKMGSDKASSAKASSRPKSFIIPREPVKTAKCDPVALYHYYKSEWQKQKIPGEDNRADLRWAIRAKMRGDAHSRPASVMPSTETLAKKRQCCRC